MLGAGLGEAAGQSSEEDHDRWMTFYNLSGLDAVGIYIMPAKDRSCCWSHDLLGDTIERREKKRETEREKGKKRKLPDKEAPINLAHVKLDDGSGACRFHIRVATRHPGWEWFFDNVDVCNKSAKGREITLTDPLPPETQDEASRDKERLLIVDNVSRYAIQQIFVIPSEKLCCWSRDLFPAHGKAKGSTIVNFDDGSGRCVFDIRVTSDGKTSDGIYLDWYVFNVNVCGGEHRILLRDLLTDTEKQRRRPVTVRNSSPFPAITLEVKPLTAEGEPLEGGKWSDDLLGRYIIPGRSFLEVDFGDRLDTCRFEYRVTKSRGRPWVGKIDACAPDATIVLFPDKVHADGKRRLVVIRNDSKVDAVTAYARPVDDKETEWSEDLLGIEIIPGGQSLEVDFDDEKGTCRFEYRVTKDKGPPWVGKVDACSEPPAPLPILRLP